MKKNIIFLLKLRNYIFNSYQTNRYYTYISNNSVSIMDDNNFFDNESIAIFNYFEKNCHESKIYLLRKIDQFNMNVIMCMYKKKQDVINILKYNNLFCSDYINKNIMSCILFVCQYNNNYFIFSTIPKQKLIKYDQTSESQFELINYYYKDNINMSNIWFSNDSVKYIKINNEFKVTKFYPFLINL
jgi:hypothetical protein